MPGILPMKVIKVGTSAQTRIAQACDRCRSKKIRCDGFRPTCTQCANVGFECKTSDKLSRRAFPRGYTESLEERVRALECETRELKDLLDEKDEKIEMLSKMHAQSPHSPSSRRPSSIHSSSDKGQIQESLELERDVRFKLQQSPYLIPGLNTDLFFVGNSSSRAFMLTFKRKLQECGKANADFNIDAFSAHSSKPLPKLLPSDESALWTPPSRMYSDQMVNIFFQEWAPLFPVLHRPTFLTLYDQYTNNTSNIQDKKSLAQLNLVFGIAALSSKHNNHAELEACERQWVAAIDHFAHETSLVTLQCLILAQIYCIQKGEPDKVLQYKGPAVAMALRLGLNVSQKRFALGVLTIETRKKVFWSLYSVDCFTAALLGLSRMLKDEDVHCEYPADADDEYVTEKGFQPSLPGETTKLSSALAMFRGCRIFAKILSQNYPAASSQEVSLSSISSLNDELEDWSNTLPTHLKLEFAQDKPSTNIISSRSPLLSLTYNYLRTLVHRPVVSSNLGGKASSSVVALAAANKQIIQIIQLLDERGLSFSHCLNKNELLLTSGLGLLFQSLELDRDGKMLRDSQRLVCQVIGLLDKRNAPGAADFKQLGCSMLALPLMSPTASTSKQASPTHKRSKGAAAAMPPDDQGNHKHMAQLAASLSRFSTVPAPNKTKGFKESQKSVPELHSTPHEQPSRRSSDKAYRPIAPSLVGRSSKHSSALATPAIEVTRPGSGEKHASKSTSLNGSRTNLDYFSFLDSVEPVPATAQVQARSPVAPHRQVHKEASWESVLSTLGSIPHTGSPSTGVYDWPPMERMLSPATLESTSRMAHSPKIPTDDGWAHELWNFNNEHHNIPQSVLSFSDESLTSGEEFSSVEHSSSEQDFRTISIPHLGEQVFTPEEFADVDGFQVELGA